MAKKLIVNCGTCDARSVSEETLCAYESVSIHAGEVMVTPETKLLLNRYNVTMDCGSVRELDKDTKLKQINGKAQIKSTDQVAGTVYLSVNGTLEIGPDTQKVLESYVAIEVNGQVTYPESMTGHLGMLQVNGETVAYPDVAIVLRRSAVIDRTFALRAKERLYWSAKRMVMVDPKLDTAALAAKGATFSSKEVILTESMVEALVDRIDENAELIIVPDGTSVILDDLELDEFTVKKYGTRLYVTGQLRIAGDDAGQLEQLEYLNVRGDVLVSEKLKGLLMEKATEIGGKVKLRKGRYLSDKRSLRISKKLLEQEPDGLHVMDCVEVTLDADIPTELILERLTICDCVEVHCTPEQESVLGMVCQDVVSIETQKDETEGGNMFQDFFGTGGQETADATVINAGSYVL